MSGGSGINVFVAPAFKKAVKRLAISERKLIDDEIDIIVNDPEIGELKKGDLSYMRVHKFTLNKRQILLGYSWKKQQLELYLLSVGPHENFYRDAKGRRVSDLKVIR